MATSMPAVLGALIATVNDRGKRRLHLGALQTPRCEEGASGAISFCHKILKSQKKKCEEGDLNPKRGLK